MFPTHQEIERRRQEDQQRRQIIHQASSFPEPRSFVDRSPPGLVASRVPFFNPAAVLGGQNYSNQAGWIEEQAHFTRPPPMLGDVASELLRRDMTNDPLRSDMVEPLRRSMAEPLRREIIEPIHSQSTSSMHDGNLVMPYNHPIQNLVKAPESRLEMPSEPRVSVITSIGHVQPQGEMSLVDKPVHDHQESIGDWNEPDGSGGPLEYEDDEGRLQDSEDHSVETGHDHHDPNEEDEDHHDVDTDPHGVEEDHDPHDIEPDTARQGRCRL